MSKSGSRNVHALMESLNKSNLHNVVSIRPHIPRSTIQTNVNTRGKLFRIQNLHQNSNGEGFNATTAAAMRNKRGFSTGKRITVAHAPSMVHWLFHRCGLSFEETQIMFEQRRILVDGSPVDKQKDLEYQLSWEEFRMLNLTLRMPSPAVATSIAQGGSTSASSSLSNLTEVQKSAAVSAMVEVPALQRALHRTYAIMCLDRTVSMSNDLSDPKSFVHRLNRIPCLAPLTTAGGGGVAAAGSLQRKASSIPFCDDVSRTAVNVLRPPGVISGGAIHGITLATNDVSTVRYWNNEYLGNYGVYDVRFPQGTPVETYTAALKDVEEALERVRRETMSADVNVPCRVVLEDVDAVAASSSSAKAMLKLAPVLWERSKIVGGRGGGGSGDPNSSSSTTSSSFVPLGASQRLLIETPLLPFRVVSRLRRNGAFISLIRCGPFRLPMSLAMAASSRKSTQGHEHHVHRLMSLEEMTAMYAFEKKMKTNLLVYTLREFERGDAAAEDLNE